MKHLSKKLQVLLLVSGVMLFGQSTVFGYKLSSSKASPTKTQSSNQDTQTQSPTKWTIMIYAQADSVLNSFAARNFHAMSTVGSNEDLNLIVQWNQPRKKGVWRYKINKNQMELVDKSTRKEKPDFSQDLIDFADFSAKNYPAENYVLILWNHGVGIIDPEWNKLQNFAVNPTTLRECPRAQIPGITCDTDIAADTICKADTICDEQVRGILFDIGNRTYLSNQGLTYALDYITKNIIKKKFELIGMDACLMSMLEVYYQIKDFAIWSVASEEVELAHGWNYTPFLHALINDSLSSKELAEKIVYTFEDFYKGKTKFYTQTALKLENVELVKENLDQIVSNILLCKKTDAKNINLAIKKARKTCFQLSVPCYVDLHSFYTELQTQLDRLKKSPKQKTFTKSDNFKDLQASINDGIQLIDAIILASTNSDYLSRARGISIYFPQKSIDQSYFKTLFVQSSLWLPFLQHSLQ